MPASLGNLDALFSLDLSCCTALESIPLKGTFVVHLDLTTLLCSCTLTS